MAQLRGLFRFGLAVLFAVAGVESHAQDGVAPPFALMSDPLSRAASASRGKSSKNDEIDMRRLVTAAGRLLPQRPGITDAYVVAVALDSDFVFAREAREAARVLARRYDAVGRTLALAGPDGRGIDPLPGGSPQTLADALARIASIMDPAEDALILYVTAHGLPSGIAYRDQGELLATLAPAWFTHALRHDGLRNRLIILSACFSGVFVPALSSPESAVITAAAKDRTSFGCTSENDWTFFGDALINHGLRKRQPLAAAFGGARGLVGSWEARGKLIPSDPQIAIGSRVGTWLDRLDARTPKEPGTPVGRPAIDALKQAIAANQ